MLVLQRKEGQTIVLGDDVVIHISQVRGNSVSVAIEAPKELTIRRGELNDWSTDSTINSQVRCDDNPNFDNSVQHDDARRIHLSDCVADQR